MAPGLGRYRPCRSGRRGREPPPGSANPPGSAPGRTARCLLAGQALRVPATYSVVYFAVVVIYFTHAADIVASGDLPAVAIPALYAAIGVTGMVGIVTGAAAQRVSSSRVAALCLIMVAAALALLGLASNSLIATAGSAFIFGVGYMAGSAVLAVWTAELVPDHAGAAFTGCLVIGAISSVAAPALAGVVTPRWASGHCSCSPPPCHCSAAQR